MSQDNESLVKAAAAGVEEAFQALIEQYRPRLRKFICDRTGEHLRGYADPEDVLQDVFLAAFKRLPEFTWNGDRAFFAWLATIAHSRIAEIGRRVKRRAARLGDEPGADPTPSRTLRRIERFERLEAAISSLPDDYRDVLVMTRIQQMPIRDVAAQMGRSPAAVTKLVRRALDRLRILFGDESGSLALPAQPPGGIDGSGRSYQRPW